MAEDKSREAPETSPRGGEEMSESEIDRNLLETFPASDPPSWTLGTDHRREPPAPDPEPPVRDESE